MAFPSADAGSGDGADSGGRGHARGHPGEGVAGADSGGRDHARGHPGEGGAGAYSGGRGHARGHHPGEGARGAYSGGRGHARGHYPGEGARGAYSGGPDHARGHYPGEGARGAYSGGPDHARGHYPGEGGTGAGGWVHAPGHTGEGCPWARPWEAPGGQSLRWFSKAAVAMGFRSDPDKRRGYTPPAIQKAPVELTPAQIGRAELYEFKKQLDELLEEAKLKLKTPTDLDTDISVTVLKPWQGLLLKAAIAFTVPLTSKRPGAVQMGWKIGFTAVDVMMDNQSLNSKYFRLLNEFTLSMRYIVEYAREKNEISEECAIQFLNELRKFHTNVSMVLAGDHGRFLEALQQLPQKVCSFADNVLYYGSAFRVINYFADAAYRVSQLVGDSALFDDIGKEVTDMTRDPFLLNNVHLGAMQNYSVTLGSEIVGVNLLKKMMLNVKNSDLSICLSASEVKPGQAAEPNGADVNLYNLNFAELHAEKLFADNIKGILHIPYSLGDSKLELQTLLQFHSISGCIGLNRKKKPSFSLSSFCGVKDLKLHNVESLGFGGKLHINDGDSWVNCSTGVSVSSLWCKLGLTFKQPGLFTATCSSRICNPSTVLGGYISYSYEEDRTKFAAGVLHSVDNSMYLKSCIRSDKVLSASGLVSKSFGKSSVNLVAEVDLKDFWKLPRAGIYFSFPLDT